jgi:hypothetical protein
MLAMRELVAEEWAFGAFYAASLVGWRPSYHPVGQHAAKLSHRVGAGRCARI